MHQTTAGGRVTRMDLTEAVGELFRPSAGGGAVGIELELIAALPDAPHRPVALRALEALLARDPSLVADACISFEPGGQLELSPPPGATAAAALATLGELVARVRACGAAEGVVFVSAGADPWHACEDVGLQVDRPRYRAMQRHFDAIGGCGRRMMRQTAALQVCLDLAPGLAGVEQWRLANLAGPALQAAFAASPVLEGQGTGWRSTRSRLWQRTDGSRTGFGDHLAAGNPVVRYVEFAAAADAIPLPRPGAAAPAPVTIPFATWLDGGGERPDAADLTHHLTTLFPPVRPRRYLELRYIDALPERWWSVPVCVLAALLHDRASRRAALDALDGVVANEASWRTAAREALADRALHRQASALFDIALDGMHRLGAAHVTGAARACVEDYRDHFVRRGRTPADDLLELWRRQPEEVAAWT